MLQPGFVEMQCQQCRVHGMQDRTYTPLCETVKNAERLREKHHFQILDRQLKMNNALTTQGSPVREQLEAEDILCVSSLDGRERGGLTAGQ